MDRALQGCKVRQSNQYGVCTVHYRVYVCAGGRSFSNIHTHCGKRQEGECVCASVCVSVSASASASVCECVCVVGWI